MSCDGLQKAKEISIYPNSSDKLSSNYMPITTMPSVYLGSQKILCQILVTVKKQTFSKKTFDCHTASLGFIVF